MFRLLQSLKLNSRLVDARDRSLVEEAARTKSTRLNLSAFIRRNNPPPLSRAYTFLTRAVHTRVCNNTRLLAPDRIHAHYFVLNSRKGPLSPSPSPSSLIEPFNESPVIKKPRSISSTSHVGGRKRSMGE